MLILSLLQLCTQASLDISPLLSSLSLLLSSWCPTLCQPTYSHRDGGSSSSRQDVHVQETHSIPQLDRHAHQRYTALTNTHVHTRTVSSVAYRLQDDIPLPQRVFACNINLYLYCGYTVSCLLFASLCI